MKSKVLLELMLCYKSFAIVIFIFKHIGNPPEDRARSNCVDLERILDLCDYILENFMTKRRG